MCGVLFYVLEVHVNQTAGGRGKECPTRPSGSSLVVSAIYEVMPRFLARVFKE